MKDFFKKHKNLYAILIVVILTIFLIGGLITIYILKSKATNDVINYAKKGYITVADYNHINFMGGLIFDKEFTDDEGNVYVLSVDSNGHVIARIIKSVTDKPAHTHNWTVHHDKNGKVDYYYCTECISSEQLEEL